MPDSPSSTLYQTRLNVSGNTSRDRQVTKAKRVLNRSFNKSPSYYSILLNGTTTNSNINDDSKDKEQKLLLTQIVDVQSAGDIVIWENKTWISLIVDNLDGIYFRGKIKKCESSLKWLDSTGATKEAYFTSTSTSDKVLGIAEDKIMILPNERRYIAIQNNTDTIKIVKNQRFVLDNGRCWRIVNLDTMLTGIIEITLEETELNLELDDVINRVANRFSNDYSIEISNGTSINLVSSGTLQLNVVTKNNGTVMSLPVTYSSLDVIKATINGTGLITSIANGTVTIKASLQSDPTIFATVSIIVSSVVTPTNSISISGVNSIKVTQTQIESGNIMNNGVVDGSKTIIWSLFGSDGVSATTLATITSQTGTNVTIKGNSVSPYLYGDVVLKAICIQDNSIVATKTIHIVSLI